MAQLLCKDVLLGDDKLQIVLYSILWKKKRLNHLHILIIAIVTNFTLHVLKLQFHLAKHIVCLN